MQVDLSKLPDDAELKKEEIASLIGNLETKYQEKIQYLEERIQLLQNELFGRKSEKHYPGPGDLQLPIFNDGVTADEQHTVQKPADSIVVAAHKRKKRGRRPLPENLERVEIIHDLTEQEKQCPCGAALKRSLPDWVWICRELPWPTGR
jgi:transposase